ncbi:MAG: HAMP domain-containing histidine kinase [Deltaproteobacteria bacterium]|nr:HAMP domain-containing histidine kinase [Deltaproteobacteria bacterium]
MTDSGTGIPAHLQRRVFEAFFTTKPEDRGTGLGLSICKRIIEEHGGTVDMSSTPGVGTTFRVWLPGRRPDVITR